MEAGAARQEAPRVGADVAPGRVLQQEGALAAGRDGPPQDGRDLHPVIVAQPGGAAAGG